MNSDGFSELAVAHVPENGDWKDGKGPTDPSTDSTQGGSSPGKTSQGPAGEQADGQGSVGH